MAKIIVNSRGVMGAFSLNQVADLGDEFFDHSTGEDNWCVDYDPETDTCYSFSLGFPTVELDV